MLINRIISAGFATAALASASVPALAWSVWPDVDFGWYADVGRPAASTAAGAVEVFPPARPGYIWSPGHYERVGASRQVWVEGRWVKDDYADQVAYYSQRGSLHATGPTTLTDSRGNVIPTQPEAYPIDSSRR